MFYIPDFERNTERDRVLLKSFKNSGDGTARVLFHFIEGTSRFISEQDEDPEDER